MWNPDLVLVQHNSHCNHRSSSTQKGRRQLKNKYPKVTEILCWLNFVSPPPSPNQLRKKNQRSFFLIKSEIDNAIQKIQKEKMFIVHSIILKDKNWWWNEMVKLHDLFLYVFWYLDNPSIAHFIKPYRNYFTLNWISVRFNETGLSVSWNLT